MRLSFVLIFILYASQAACQDGITSFINSYQSTNLSIMPFRIIANISEKGLVLSLHLAVNSSIRKAGIAASQSAVEGLPEDFALSKRLYARDEFGNDWMLREDYRGNPISITISKALPKVQFTPSPNGADLKHPPYKEQHEMLYGLSYIDGDCTKATTDPTRKHLCCDATVDNAYYVRHKYSLGGDGDTMHCTASDPLNALRYPSGGFQMFMTVVVRLLGVERVVSTTINHFPSMPITSFTTADTNVTIQSTLRQSDLSLFMTQPSYHSLCSQAPTGLTDATIEPFLVPWTALTDNLHSLGLTPPTYSVKKPCILPINADGSTENRPMGWYLAPMLNNKTGEIDPTYLNGLNGDYFIPYRTNPYYTHAFNNATPGMSYGCSWTGSYTNDGFNPPSLSLTCNQDNTPHLLLLAIKVPKYYFQPQFPFVTLDAKQGVYDLRTRRLRLSVWMWASGEHAATVSVSSLYCSFDGKSFTGYDSAAFSNRATARRAIDVGEAMPIHLVYKGLKLRYSSGTNVTKLHNTTIGQCYLRVDADGVKGLHSYFPKLRNISIPIVALRSEAHNYRGKAKARPPIGRAAAYFGVHKTSDTGITRFEYPTAVPPTAPITSFDAPSLPVTNTTNTKISSPSFSSSIANSSTPFLSSITHIIPLTEPLLVGIDPSTDQILALAAAADAIANTGTPDYDAILLEADGAVVFGFVVFTNVSSDNISLVPEKALALVNESTNNRQSLGEVYEEQLMAFSDRDAILNDTYTYPTVVAKAVASATFRSYPSARTALNMPPRIVYYHYPNMAKDPEIAEMYLGAKKRFGKWGSIKYPLSPNRFLLDPQLWRANQQARADAEAHLQSLISNMTNITLFLLNASKTANGTNASLPVLTDEEAFLRDREIELMQMILLNPLHNKDGVVVLPDTHPLLTDDGLWRFGVDPSGRAIDVPFHNDNTNVTLPDDTSELLSPSDRSNPNQLRFTHNKTVYHQLGDGALASASELLTQQLFEERERSYASAFAKYMEIDPLLKPAVFVGFAALGTLIMNVLAYMACYAGRVLARRQHALDLKAAEEKKQRKEERKLQKRKEEKREERRRRRAAKEAALEAEAGGGASDVSCVVSVKSTPATSRRASHSTVAMDDTAEAVHQTDTQHERGRRRNSAAKGVPPTASISSSKTTNSAIIRPSTRRASLANNDSPNGSTSPLFQSHQNTMSFEPKKWISNKG